MLTVFDLFLRLNKFDHAIPLRKSLRELWNRRNGFFGYIKINWTILTDFFLCQKKLPVYRMRFISNEQKLFLDMNSNTGYRITAFVN